MKNFVAAVLLSFATIATAAPAGNDALVEVPASPQSPFAALRQIAEITVGESVSLVTVKLEYYYVRDYDSTDHLNPFIIDVPVLVREEDTDAGRILKMFNARLDISHKLYRPQNVLLLDHTAYEPVPDVPAGARIALISFNIPRKNLKPRFKAYLAFDQPHLPQPGAGELTGYVPMLPDVEQLAGVHHFEPDDFLVTFTALPEIRLRRESINAEVVTDTPDTITVRTRPRETVLVTAEKTTEPKP